MTADDAKNITLQAQQDLRAAQYAEVLNGIKDVAKKGYFEVNFSGSIIKDFIKNRLIKDGFKVTKYIVQNHTYIDYYKIAWS